VKSARADSVYRPWKEDDAYDFLATLAGEMNWQVDEHLLRVQYEIIKKIREGDAFAKG
jgi:hypothetical protein